MLKTCVAILLIFLQTLPLLADDGNPAALWRRFSRTYEQTPIPPVDLTNTPRIRQLLRAGNIYLSLSDAVALGIENNLDIELQRYTQPIADSELLRAQGGGLLRGLTYTLAEAPVGVGGPASPLVTSAASGNVPGGSVPTNPSELGVLAEPIDNLLVQETTPLSNGPVIPQFDPALIYQLNSTHQTTPQTNPFVVGATALATNTTLFNGGYVQGFGPGTQLNVAYNNARETLNSSRTSYSPFTSSNFGFTVTQPLLRGFGLAVNRRFIRIAKNEKRIADLLLRQQLIATVYGVVRLYTDLVALYEDVKVKEETLSSAEKLYSDTKARVDEGTQAPIELTRANAQVFGIRQDVINARGLLEEQEAIVKNVITRRSSDDVDILNARVIPTDSIDVPENDDVRPIQDLLGQAFSSRPDLKQAGVQIDNSQISLEGSRNNLLPEIDLVGVAQNSALAGQPNPLASSSVDPTFVGGYGSALEQLVTRKYPTYGIGLNLNLPLRNRIAHADLARDEIQVRRTQIRFEQLRKQAQLEVEDALVAMRRARASYEAALQSQALQQESLEAEQAKFDVGASTSFFIVQYQSYLAQARSTVVVAKSAYLKARAALERATGSILEDNHVIIPDAMRGR
ncbi:MAG TPA: TolC family protein [Bryobacteraceae bacterium]|nr:TolC family protein [Bryobacteraceae bacterium]